MDKEVIIEEYKTEWNEQFEHEKAKIRLALLDKTVVIEHIGSTSINGLPSKPIIDIDVGVNELSEADSFIEPLRAIGYEYVPKEDFPSRRFFRKGEWRKGTHHLHVYEINIDEWNNNLLFRNYLRSHPEKVQEYTHIKKQLASLYAEDRVTYTKMKAIIELAKRNI